jgi:hypothetical protein
MSRTSNTQPKPSQPTFTQNIKQGLSFGIGTNIAQRIMGSIFGPSTQLLAPTTPPVTNSNTTIISENHHKDFVGKAPLDLQIAYQQCLKDDGDHEKCKDYLI